MRAGLVSLQEGKERLGHRRETTTQKVASTGQKIGILPSLLNLVIFHL